MRFGVHTGRVVGGIVGIEKYIYDIFGDTVNTAARMEQLSEPMCINVSEEVRKAAPRTAVFSSGPPVKSREKASCGCIFSTRPVLSGKSR